MEQLIPIHLKFLLFAACPNLHTATVSIGHRIPGGCQGAAGKVADGSQKHYSSTNSAATGTRCLG